MEQKKQYTLGDVMPIINDLISKRLQKPKDEIELPSARDIATALIETFPNIELGINDELKSTIEAEIAEKRK